MLQYSQCLLLTYTVKLPVSLSNIIIIIQCFIMLSDENVSFGRERRLGNYVLCQRFNNPPGSKRLLTSHLQFEALCSGKITLGWQNTLQH